MMLVLTRKVGQVIRVGDDILIHVLTGIGGQVKIGVDAPSNVTVHREEIYQKILDLNNKRSIYDCPKEKIKYD